MVSIEQIETLSNLGQLNTQAKADPVSAETGMYCPFTKGACRGQCAGCTNAIKEIVKSEGAADPTELVAKIAAQVKAENSKEFFSSISQGDKTALASAISALDPVRQGNELKQINGTRAAIKEKEGAVTKGAKSQVATDRKERTEATAAMKSALRDREQAPGPNGVNLEHNTRSNNVRSASPGSSAETEAFLRAQRAAALNGVRTQGELGIQQSRVKSLDNFERRSADVLKTMQSASPSQTTSKSIERFVESAKVETIDWDRKRREAEKSAELKSIETRRSAEADVFERKRKQEAVTAQERQLKQEEIRMQIATSKAPARGKEIRADGRALEQITRAEAKVQVAKPSASLHLSAARDLKGRAAPIQTLKALRPQPSIPVKSRQSVQLKSVIEKALANVRSLRTEVPPKMAPPKAFAISGGKSIIAQSTAVETSRRESQVVKHRTDKTVVRTQQSASPVSKDKQFVQTRSMAVNARIRSAKGNTKGEEVPRLEKVRPVVRGKAVAVDSKAAAKKEAKFTRVLHKKAQELKREREHSAQPKVRLKNKQIQSGPISKRTLEYKTIINQQISNVVVKVATKMESLRTAIAKIIPIKYLPIIKQAVQKAVSMKNAAQAALGKILPMRRNVQPKNPAPRVTANRSRLTAKISNSLRRAILKKADIAARFKDPRKTGKISARMRRNIAKEVNRIARKHGLNPQSIKKLVGRINSNNRLPRAALQRAAKATVKRSLGKGIFKTKTRKSIARAKIGRLIYLKRQQRTQAQRQLLHQLFIARQKKMKRRRKSGRSLGKEFTSSATSIQGIKKDLKEFIAELDILMTEQKNSIGQDVSLPENRMLALRLEALKRIIKDKKKHLKMIEGQVALNLDVGADRAGAAAYVA